MLNANEIARRMDTMVGNQPVVSPYSPGQSADLNERARTVQGTPRTPRGGTAFVPLSAIASSAASSLSEASSLPARPQGSDKE